MNRRANIAGCFILPQSTFAHSELTIEFARETLAGSWDCWISNGLFRQKPILSLSRFEALPVPAASFLHKTRG